MKSKFSNSRRLKKLHEKPSQNPVSLPSHGESDQIIHAILHGRIDALVMQSTEGERVLTLEGSEHPYRVVLESVNDGAATVDASGAVLYANRRFEEILRAPSGSLVGKTLKAHLTKPAFRKLRELVATGLNASTHGEITLEAPDGRQRLVRLALSPLANGNQHNVCIVATELTELVEANAALKSNEESLRQLSARLLKLQDEERRHIARDLHDITGQKLAAQSMTLSQVLNRKDSSLDDDARRLLAECATLNKQVGEEIRTLSYLLHPPLLDELGLASAVKWYAEGFERRTGIKIEVHFDADFSRLAQDAEVTLFRVIQESLANVHRYSGSQKAAVRVCKTLGNEVEVQIEDFGKGMNPTMLGANRDAVAPLGVGIQGMRERMRQLGGQLEITSRLNRGTTVTARLPLVLQQTTPAVESAPSPATAAGSSAADEAVLERGTPRKRILIADDHEMLRRGIRSALKDQSDWEIVGEAINGQDAVDKTIALKPDLVILDINMPRLNGLVAVRQILRGRPRTKILIFTVHDSDQTVKEIRAAGAHAYLSKNDAGDDLLRVVKELLEERKPTLNGTGISASAAAN
jgi:PAS domain S-box-containing protein